MIFLGCLIISYNINIPYLNEATGRGYYSFFTGVILAEVMGSDCFKKHSRSRKINTIITITLGILIWLIIKHWSVMQNGIQFTLTFIFYPCIIILVSNLNCYLKKFKILRTLCDISFEVYLWHSVNFILLDILTKKSILHYPVYSRLGMYIFAISCYIYSTVIHFGIEKPLYKALKELVNKEKTNELEQRQ